MRYIYGTDDSYTTVKGTVATARQLATIIKRDVELGNWNLYDGGKSNTRTAKCRYSKKGFSYHSHLLIYGDKGEFALLEALIKDFIEVIPRDFNNI